MAHIVLDTRIIETSTGRYMQRLLENLHDNYTRDGNRYTALIPSIHVEKWQQRLPRFAIVAADQKWYGFAEQTSLYRLLRSLDPDLVHFTMPQQPILYTRPSVTTVHDMTLIRFNTGEGKFAPLYWFKKMVFLGLMQVVMRRSKSIIVPTNFVKNDLAKFFGKNYLPKISVTYEAGEITEAAPQTIEQLIDKQYFCYVGNAFTYKNISRIILAHQQLQIKNPDIHLVLAGKYDSSYQNLAKFVETEKIPNVHILGFISDGEKRWLLQNAQAFITASKSEGFCIPLLEAMSESCPVISSNQSCLPEVAGEAALYFDPDSTTQLVDNMQKMIDDNNLRLELVKRGSNHLKSFSWRKMTDQTHTIYENTMNSLEL